MYTIEKINNVNITNMRNDYYNQLTAPMDDFWEEGIIPSCDFYTISTSKIIGYYAVDDEGVLLQFYLVNTTNYDEIFKEVVLLQNIKRFYAATYDPLLYNACKKLNATQAENTYLYSQDTLYEPITPIDGITYRIATKEDVHTAVGYNESKLDETGLWLTGYYTKLIQKNGLYFFLLNGEIIGTGESRKSASSINISNIGVTVSKDHRRKGIAEYIINTMRVLNNKLGYHTICSTTVDNIGSQKTLLKCGYTLYNRIDTFTINY